MKWIVLQLTCAAFLNSTVTECCNLFGSFCVLGTKPVVMAYKLLVVLWLKQFMEIIIMSLAFQSICLRDILQNIYRMA